MRDIVNKLSETRSPIHKLHTPNQGGIYAFFLKGSSEIGNIPANSNGLIYVGSSKSLASRQFDTHFNSQGTGFSTIRRSIGAILKDELNLKAFPRSSGSSKINVQNYKFNFDGEERLTIWMKKNIEVGICSLDDFGSIEKDLIAELQPILNLTDWDNPFRKRIKELRKLCVNEARKNRNA